MSAPPTHEQLRDWRFQCEERIRRWADGRAVSEWHLGIHETLALLDLVRDLQAEVESQRPVGVAARQHPCPTCSAVVGAPCKTIEHGYYTAIHAARRDLVRQERTRRWNQSR